MPPQIARAFAEALDKICADPLRKDLDIKRLRGRPGYRLRIGDWRMIYEFDGDCVVVLDMGPRGSVYR